MAEGGKVEPENILKGGYPNKFVDKTDYFECAVCISVARDPIQTECGHSFCQTCLNDWKKNNVGQPLRCPVDNEVVDVERVFRDRKQSRAILDLKVLCDNRENGCEDTIELRYIEAHLKTCQHQMVSCDLMCGHVMLLWSVKDHVTNDCPRRMVTCPVCECEMFAMDFNTHDEKCPMQTTPCEYCTSEDILRKNMSSHHDNDCINFPTFCSFALLGCSEKITRQDLERHHESHMKKHLQLLNTATSRIGYPPCSQNEPQLELPVPLWGETENNEFNKASPLDELPHTAKVKKHQHEDSLFDRVNKLEAKLVKMEQKHAEDLRKMSNGELVVGIRNKCLCKWYVDLVKEMEDFDSPDFYTRDGYRMCLNVGWNAERARFIIGAVLLQGDNDANLVWPWRGTEEVRFCDFSTRNNVVVNNLSLADEAGRGRVIGVQNRNDLPPLHFVDLPGPQNAPTTPVYFTVDRAA